MQVLRQEALQITRELTGRYHDPARVQELLSQLIRTTVDESLTVLPPVCSDFAKNISLGKRIFINSGCKLQDQGGIVIGDACLIGHNAVLATLNDDLHPARRADMHPSPSPSAATCGSEPTSPSCPA